MLGVPASVWLALGSVSAGGTPSAPPASIGVVEDRAVPSAVLRLPLLDQQGRPVTLDRFRGRAVFLVPFLTSCQEECPITTGALLAMARSIRLDGLSHRVVIAEVTVDPGRDTPARLAAYAGLTGSHWPLLTASSVTVARLWHYFGVHYRRVPEGSPPGIDWETRRPYAYDVNHTEGFVLLDPRLHERFSAGGMAKVSGVPKRLAGLLDAQGRANLRDPGGGSWTVAGGLEAIGWVLGRPVPDLVGSSPARD